MAAGAAYAGMLVVLSLIAVRPVGVASKPADSKQPAARARTSSVSPPKVPPLKRTPPKAEAVSFETDEKTPVTIVGAYTPPASTTRVHGAPMVILLPMYGEDHAAFEPLIGPLHDAGFAVLAIDLRGHGGSVEPASLKLAERMKEREPKLFREMDRDVEAAYRWLARRPEVDASRFALVGASVGANIALDYAARDKSVDVVICMTPGVEYLGVDALGPARKLGPGRKVLLLASEAEEHAAAEIGKLVEGSQVKILAGRPGVVRTDDALHGTRMFGHVADVEQSIAEFAAEAVGSASDDVVVASMKGEVYYDRGSSQADRLSPGNLRFFSSPAEAESRGFRPPKRGSRRD